jgi:hypothetical protein
MKNYKLYWLSCQYGSFEMLEKTRYQDLSQDSKFCVIFFEKRNLQTHGNTTELFQKLFLS